jgi:hypothetical protein
MERFGILRVVSGALLLVAGSSGLTLVMTVAAVAALGSGGRRRHRRDGAGAGRHRRQQLVRESRRGLVTGIFSAASATGQLIFLPGIAALASGPGRRYAALVTTVAAVLLVAVVLVLVADTRTTSTPRTAASHPPVTPAWRRWGSPKRRCRPQEASTTLVSPARLVV